METDIYTAAEIAAFLHPEKSQAVKIRLLTCAINSMLLLSQTEPDPLDRRAFQAVAERCQQKLRELLEGN